jgi:hypothetical protein
MTKDWSFTGYLEAVSCPQEERSTIPTTPNKYAVRKKIESFIFYFSSLVYPSDV